MSFNGNGVFERLYNWVADAANGIFIKADRMDAEMNGFATGLSLCLTRDSQAAMIANLKMGGFAINNLKDPEADQDAATRKFVSDSINAAVKPTISDNPPADPAAGDMWFKTSIPIGLFVWVTDATSGAWKFSAGDGTVPPGSIIMWSGLITTVPVGWKLCDGTNGTPNLRNKFIVGAGDEYAMNDEGGAKEVTLTEAQMPAHLHGVNLNTNSQGAHTHDVTVRASGSGVTSVLSFESAGTTQQLGGRVSSSGAHTHNVAGDTGSKGGGAAHENRPPYFALAYIMKS